jgi:hypothetical protein
LNEICEYTREYSLLGPDMQSKENVVSLESGRLDCTSDCTLCFT